MRYTEEEINFLIENYPKYGTTYCKPFLRNRNNSAITALANRLGLSAKNRVVHPSLQAVSINNFLNIDSKEIAYFLGYFWADGNIINYTSNNITHWRIALEIQVEDAIVIESILLSFGKWSIQKRKRKDNWKETWTFITNNKDLWNFLNDNGYSQKSNIEPSQILEKIPEQLHIYFWKGLIDGDGSVGLVGRGSYFEISSTYDYKYNSITNYIKLLGVSKYHIYRTISKKGHKSSTIKLYGKEILKLEPIFIEYGLIRKTDKFKQIKNKYANISINTEGFL